MSFIKEIIVRWYYWLRRQKAIIVILLLSAFGLSSFSIAKGNIQVILYKSFLLAFGTSLTFFIVQYLFPDIGFWRLIFGKEKFEGVDPMIRAATILGLFYFFASVVSAFMQGG